jgi:hypothetical protein
MTEEEREQLLQSMIGTQGSISPGWSAAAGAEAHMENPLLMEFNRQWEKRRLERKDPMYPWRADTTTLQERYNTQEGWHFKTDPEVFMDWVRNNPDTVEKILTGAIGAAAGNPAYNIYKALEWTALNAPDRLEKAGFTPERVTELGGKKGLDETGERSDMTPEMLESMGLDPLEPSPGNPHQDKSGDFWDWLNENLPPLEPATEKPEYTPWEMPEYKPPPTPREEWASMYPDSYMVDGVKIQRTKYPGDLFGTVKPLIYGIGAKRNAGKIKYDYDSTGAPVFLRDAEGNYLRNPIADYSKLRSPYPNALNIYALGTGIKKYVGEPGYENLLGLESPEGDTTSWMRAQHAAIDAQMQAEYQQELIDKKERYNTENELAKREHRSSYDEMVAEMVETERLRQEEYAAERQRYTDRYNENPDFYGNLFSGGDDGILPSDRTLSTDMTRHPGQELGAIDSAILSAIPFINALGGGEPLIDYPHRIGPDVGQPIDNPFGFSDVGQPISQPGYISQQDLLLNQNRPGGGIGLSEQILNQAKPGAYLYPGMLN